ncbi:MAG: CoA transferase [Tindallia sp. MSAO_Bac2]|nr:MAG: CoA transferase [Tindallia sp. MSAO_Bac2]
MVLKGVKIIDLSRVLAGPYCTMILADLGAEVIKVENPGIGDDSRSFGPFKDGESLYFNGINRNKKSIELNLKDENDRMAFLDLVKDADVVVENFRPGTMKKLKIGYETIQKINPGIIYAATSGFGQTGPESEKPAYDLIIQALGGMMSITGEEGGSPTKVGSSIADINAGMFTAIGIISALFHREKTGEGQMVDVSMLDCQVAVLENAIARYLTTQEDPKPIGNRHPTISPFSMYPTADDYIVVAAGSPKLWGSFCDAIGRKDLFQDPRFADNQLRTENIQELDEIIAPIFELKTTQEWMQILESKGIPCAPVNRISDVMENKQLKARNMIEEIDHPILGSLKMVGTPIKLSKTPGGIRRNAPKLGEHNDEILLK